MGPFERAPEAAEKVDALALSRLSIEASVEERPVSLLPRETRTLTGAIREQVVDVPTVSSLSEGSGQRVNAGWRFFAVMRRFLPKLGQRPHGRWPFL